MVVAFITVQKFSPEQDKVWNTLFNKQWEAFEDNACTQFTEGMEDLDLDPERMSTLEELDEKIRKFSDWRIVRAENRYLSDIDWFEHLAKKNWPVSDFIREPEELEFTPLPDFFHDVFGHLAFITNKEFLEISEIFAKAFLKANNEWRKVIGRIWWHTVEFGLIRENGKVKMLGAGLISSEKELVHAQNIDRHIPFSIVEAARTPKARADIHPKFFVVESLEQVKNAGLQLLELVQNETI